MRACRSGLGSHRLSGGIAPIVIITLNLSSHVDERLFECGQNTACNSNCEAPSSGAERMHARCDTPSEMCHPRR